MKSESNGDTWLEACDLCGSLDYKVLVVGKSTLHRCRVCGLTGRSEESDRSPDERSLGDRFIRSAIKRLERDIPDGTELRLLLIGADETTLATGSARRQRVIETHYSGTIESAGFRLGQFDVVIVARSLETILSPSQLFAKARIWLAPGGMLIVGGANWDSLERRVRSARWLNYYQSGRYYPGYGHLREYATRNGFEVVSSGTTSRLDAIATILYGSSSSIPQLAALPFRLVGSLPRLGSIYWSILAKRGLATRRAPLTPIEEMESAPGLATASYTSRRERASVAR